MSIAEITDRVNHLGHAWEQFRHTNDARLSELERKGSADPLYHEKLDRISDALDQYRGRLDTIEIASARPDLSTKSAAEPEDRFNHEYKAAFCQYLRKGTEAALLESKALSAGSDPDGGYMVTPSTIGRIVTMVYESSPMRRLANVVSISTDSLDVLEDTDEAAGSWTTETGTVTDTDTPQVNRRSIPTFELYAQPTATQKLIDDSAIDIEAWLADKVAEVFSRKENAAFIAGNGTTQPKGILSYAAGTGWGQIEQLDSGTDGQVGADRLIELYYRLKEEYAARATFLMNRATVKQVRLLQESATNQYLWQPGLAAGSPDTLMGVPVMQAADMPVPATDSLSIAVGDFRRAYQIVDRTGIRVLRDPFTNKPFVKFYTTKRVGGDVVNYDAIKLMKLAA